MRSMTFLTAMLVAGCATQPSATQTHLSTAPGTAPAQITQAQSPGQAPTPSVPSPATPSANADAQRLARARNLNLKMVNKDGQELFCRSNFMTTSRIQRDTTCYTAEQVDRMQEQTTRDLDQLNNRPNNIKGLP